MLGESSSSPSPRYHPQGQLPVRLLSAHQRPMINLKLDQSPSLNMCQVNGLEGAILLLRWIPRDEDGIAKATGAKEPSAPLTS